MFALRNALFHLTVVTSAFIAAPAIAGGNSGETKINWFKTLLSEDYSLQDSIHSPALGWVMVSFLIVRGHRVFCALKEPAEIPCPTVGADPTSHRRSQRSQKRGRSEHA